MGLDISFLSSGGGQEVPVPGTGSKSGTTRQDRLSSSSLTLRVTPSYLRGKPL